MERTVRACTFTVKGLSSATLALIIELPRVRRNHAIARLWKGLW